MTAATSPVPSQVVSESPIDLIVYPSSDGKPVAETYDHLYALLTILEVLRQYLLGQKATVLGNQFLYYAKGYPKLRVAPDIMVIFGVKSGGRDNYKIWDEGEIPRVVFELTSPSTRNEDQVYKKKLYAQIGVQEYWLFDPKNEWIQGQLLGYQLISGPEEAFYLPMSEAYSPALQLRLVPEGKLLSFYRQDTGEKLLIPDELRQRFDQERERADQERERADQERERADQERERADQERERADRLAEKLRALGVNPDQS